MGFLVLVFCVWFVLLVCGVFSVRPYDDLFSKQRIKCVDVAIVNGERDVAQSIACPPLKRSVVGSILLSGPSCSLGYFPFQPVVHNWFIKGRGMYCSVYGKVHIKDPLLLIEKSSLCGGSGFPSKKKACQRDHMNDVQ